MTTHLCVLICANGLGHFVRQLHIIAHLLQRRVGTRITIAAAGWQFDTLKKWSVLERLMKDARVTVLPFAPYPRWTTDARYFFDDALLSWHHALGALDLDSFDLVISDNVVEALAFTERTILAGSFLWHDVYAAYCPESPVVQEYYRRCSALLAAHRPCMIANRYFAMPAVRSETRCVAVGMMPSWVRHGGAKRSRRTVLFAASGRSPAVAHLKMLLDAAAAGAAPCIDLRVDARLEPLLDMSSSARVFDYDTDDFCEIAAVVARPGIGTVTDCVATGTPLFCLSERNPEMTHNAGRVEALGLGVRVEPGPEALRVIVEVLSSEAAWERHTAAARAIGRSGDREAADFIIQQVN